MYINFYVDLVETVMLWLYFHIMVYLAAIDPDTVRYNCLTPSKPQALYIILLEIM